VEVRRLTRGGLPSQVRFRFDSNLDDPNLVVLCAWGSRGLERVAPPPQGATTYVPRAPPFLEGAFRPAIRMKAIEPD
jgi:hypothetical protein